MNLIDSERFVIFDTEYTSWEGCNKNGWDADKGQYKELVQIGAVKVKRSSVLPTYNKNVDIKNYFSADTLIQNIKPQINPTLSDYFINLTGIKQSDVDNAPKFKNAIEKFFDWCEDFPIYSYGADNQIVQLNIDMYALSDQIDLSDKIFYNLREILREKGFPVNEYTSGTLTKYFGVEPTHPAHNALADTQTILDFLNLIHSVSDFKHTSSTTFNQCS